MLTWAFIVGTMVGQPNLKGPSASYDVRVVDGRQVAVLKVSGPKSVKAQNWWQDRDTGLFASDEGAGKLPAVEKKGRF